MGGEHEIILLYEFFYIKFIMKRFDDFKLCYIYILGLILCYTNKIPFYYNYFIL